jgi:hypothetical protein
MTNGFPCDEFAKIGMIGLEIGLIGFPDFTMETYEHLLGRDPVGAGAPIVVLGSEGPLDHSQISKMKNNMY